MRSVIVISLLALALFASLPVDAKTGAGCTNNSLVAGTAKEWCAVAVYSLTNVCADDYDYGSYGHLGQLCVNANRGVCEEAEPANGQNGAYICYIGLFGPGHTVCIDHGYDSYGDDFYLFCAL